MISRSKRISNIFITTIGKSLFANAGYLISVDVVNSLVGFLFWGLAAHLYTPYDIGLASAVISVVTLISMISSLGTGSGLIRFLPESHNRNRMVNSLLIFNIFCGLLVGIIFLVGLPIFSQSLVLLQSNILLVACFLSYAFANTFASSLRMTFLALRKAKYSFWQSVSINAARLPLVAILAGFGVWGIVASTWLAVTVSILLGFLVFLPLAMPNYRFNIAISKTDLSRILPYSFGNYVAFFLVQAPTRLLPILILELDGPKSAAHAQIAWLVGGFLSTPGLALATSAFVEASNTPAQSVSIFSRAAVTGLLFTSFAAVFTFLVAPWLLLLFGPSYAVEGTVLLRWLAAAAPFSVLVGFYFAKLRVQKRIGYLIALSAVLASITIGSTAVLTSSIDLMAFGIGWFASNLLVSMIAIRETYKNPKSRIIAKDMSSSLRAQLK